MTKSELPDGYLEAFKPKGFVLKKQIGSGASGTVFRATQQSLDREVAIKVFDNPHTMKDTKLRKRFEHEARLLARVKHPSVPVVLTRGEVIAAGIPLPYTAMEFIDGRTLEVVIKDQRRLELVRAVAYACQVLGALAAAHAERIVHRDVKPANMIVEPKTGHVHLIDFSIGVSLDTKPGLTRVTAEGNQPGSYEYMAPEQKAGREVDHRADIYSFGLVLFEMLTGHPRVNLGTLDADLKDVPADVRAIIAKACQEDKADRFDSTEALLRALMPFGTAIRAREEPADALCLNLKCSAAQWTEFGYYEGPRVVHGTKDDRCELCGSKLSYPCEKCGRSFSGNPYCGSCGNQHYDVPECKQCGSWLKKDDIATDTATSGCQKCRNKRPRQAGSNAPADSFRSGGYGGADDDNPF